MADDKVKSIRDYKYSKLSKEDQQHIEDIGEENFPFDPIEVLSKPKQDDLDHGTLLNNEYKLEKTRNQTLRYYEVKEKSILLEFTDEEFNTRKIIISVNNEGNLEVTKEE